jgi:hypothetical protein
MLGVEAQIKTLQVAQPSADVSNFIDRGGFMQSRAAGQKKHHGKQTRSSGTVKDSWHEWQDQFYVTASVLLNFRKILGGFQPSRFRRPRILL